MVQRPEYLEELKKFKDKDLIKVVTGIRRCGKSTLFELYRNYLIKIGVEEKQIISINLENPEYDFKDYMDLYNYVKERLIGNKMNYVFLDEVQNVPDFQKAVDGLYIKKNVDLYITGSNANLLSGELATLLSGRYIEIKMLPLSFKEYLSDFDETKDLNTLFLDYLKYGSLPRVVELVKEDKELTYEYLDGIFSTIVYKDIMSRKNVNDKLVLESIIKFIFDSIGSPITTKKISDTLTSMNRATSNHTVENYISSLLESFIIYKAERINIKGKQYLASGYKYYCVDMGLRNYLLGDKAGQDMGHIIENIVFLELKRRGYKVYVGKNDDLEVDFVAQNKEGYKYFQVALTTREENTLKRELRPLQKINDHYPKYILTMDNDLDADYEGIKKVKLIDWLLDK